MVNLAAIINDMKDNGVFYQIGDYELLLGYNYIHNCCYWYDKNYCAVKMVILSEKILDDINKCGVKRIPEKEYIATKTRINNKDNWDDVWTDIKNKCRTTVNKEYTSNVPSSEFKTNLLISEHSPIRLLTINWTWEKIKSWVATHWVRHKWECFVSSQRSDRTGVDRDNLPQSALVNFDGVANAQSLIDTMRKRLCYQASHETRELAEDLKFTIKTQQPELADVLVPNCVYRCGCPEFKTCGYWNMLSKSLTPEQMKDIKQRYKVYNDSFFMMMEKKMKEGEKNYK